MATENHSPTNESSGSANPAISGAEIGGALSENDLASYLNEKTESIPKAFEGKRGGEKGKMLPNPFEPQAEASGEEQEVNSESDSDEDALDLDLLDGDSEHTKDEEGKDNDDEPMFEITVDGEKFEVKQSELIADAQKYRAATTKFRDAEKLHVTASEMRKEADEIKELYSQERNPLKGLLTQYQNFIEESYRAQQPDWNALLQNDPVEYIRQKEYWQAKQYQVEQAKAHQQQIRTNEEAELKVKQQEHLKAQQQRLYELFPTWKNPEVAKKAASKIETYLDAEGFTKEERDGLNDARLLMVAHKAALYDQLVKANNQKKGNQPSGKTLNAGATTSGDPGFAKRQQQTAAAREAKGWNDSLKSNPSQKNFEAYLANQWSKKTK
ncbi:hypothetical protein [Paraburkholderia sp. BR10882]|uniref:hypothetical protein n=1 Tax=unclassified Paraburkholderia TaxID=2615204 RepID=UPI0034CF81F9